MCKVCVFLFWTWLGLSLLTPAAVAQPITAAVDPSIPAVVRYCIDPNWFPYESAIQGKHQGISADFVQLLQARTDLQLQWVKSKNWLHTIELLRNGSCDMTPMLNHTEERDEFLDFTDVWYRSPNVLISLRDEPFLQSLDHLDGRKVALTAGYRITSYVQQHYPAIDYLEVTDELAGIQAVIDEQVDVFIGSMLSVNNHIQANGLNEVKIAGWVGPEDLLRVGVRPSHQALIPVINQFIAQISEADRIAMHKNWNDITLIDNSNQELLRQVILGFSLILLVGIMYHLLIRKMNKKLLAQNAELQSLKAALTETNQELVFLTNHDLLTQIHNRHYFNQLLERLSSKKINSNSFCMVFFDLDHFKSINDRFGHQVGDRVLKQLTATIRPLLGDKHVFIRWGGEEFVILCQDTNELSARRLCLEIKQALDDLSIDPVGHITCSFGIASKQADESIMQCIERADRAMYQAKANGRNQIITAQKMGS
ncbi:diguanylate cyclase domain-containing protein [Marinicella meishanensis]|uniref:diguanylate cyclase domain-containing protein n=1 Tax=Marinicella meishanensis TaxID=2873263 RepID=UPI001CBD2E7B